MKRLWDVYAQKHVWPGGYRPHQVFHPQTGEIEEQMVLCAEESCGCRAVHAGLAWDRERSLDTGKATPAEVHDWQATGLRPLKPSEDNFTYAPGGTVEVVAPAPSRKDYPIASGVLSYFPKALLEVAYCSKVGNDQHNPGEPLHWAREKSTDDADAAIRHFLERGKIDTDGVRHMAKACWRFLAVLEKELEALSPETP